MSENIPDNPRTFISYSWSSPEHEEWVLGLATELEESGVDVILDKWDLEEGADKFAFMEKMVTDPSVSRVIAVCDRLYAEKADGRQGGVGTETQIMSKEVYEQINPADREQKFVALIAEKDENGDAYVPTFLKSRIYIDMSDETLRAESFERLLRWIYGKPLYKRPERGKPPAYLFAEDKLNLGTGARFHRAVEAVRQNKDFASGAVHEYFETFAENLDTFRIEPEGEAFSDEVVESIESFLPYRDELVDLFLTITRYRTDSELYETIHAFFERILPYGFWPTGRTEWRKVNADNFKFILYELFLYAAAALLKHGRFEKVSEFLEPGFYFAADSPDIRRGGLVPFGYFNDYARSLEHWNQRQNPRWLSPTGHVLKVRATRTDLPFDEIMQADLILFVRHEVSPRDEDYPNARWYPHSLVYASDRWKPFEIFARAQSKAYFDRVKVALGVENLNELIRLTDDLHSGERRAPIWDFDTPYLPTLMNVEELATRT
jgi:hypothetical protein